MGKQSLSIILTSLFTIGLAGCGGSDSNDSSETMFTVSAIAEGGGNITPSMYVVEKGKIADFTLAAASGYQIDTVTGCGGTLSGNIYTTGDVIADCLITAVFRPAGHIVEVHISGGGSVEPEGLTVQHGDIAEFKTKPELAYQVADAYGCNGSLSGDTYTTGEIVSDCDIYITFQPIGGGAVLGRYIDNGDGTITDPARKLMWMRCSFGQTWQNGECVGDTSFMIGSDINFGIFYSDGNYNDWRFPTLDELRSMVFCSSGSPSYWFGANTSSLVCLGDYASPTVVNSVFPNTKAAAYITSTVENTSSGRNHYHINFTNGSVYARPTGFMGNYRYVRSIP